MTFDFKNLIGSNEIVTDVSLNRAFKRLGALQSRLKSISQASFGDLSSLDTVLINSLAATPTPTPTPTPSPTPTSTITPTPTVTPTIKPGDTPTPTPTPTRSPTPTPTRSPTPTPTPTITRTPTPTPTATPAFEVISINIGSADNMTQAVNLIDQVRAATGRTSFSRPLDVTFNAVGPIIGYRNQVNVGGGIPAIRTGTGWPAGSKVTLYNPPFETSTVNPNNTIGFVTAVKRGAIVGWGQDGTSALFHCGICWGGSSSTCRNWAQWYSPNSAGASRAGDAIWLEDSNISQFNVDNYGVIGGGGGGSPDCDYGGQPGGGGGDNAQGGRKTQLFYTSVGRGAYGPTNVYGPPWGGVVCDGIGWITQQGGGLTGGAGKTHPPRGVGQCTCRSSGGIGNNAVGRTNAGYAIKRNNTTTVINWPTTSGRVGPAGGGSGNGDPRDAGYPKNGIIAQ